MVGFKNIWMTIGALFLLASCVPQTKQTACDDDETFSSTLRTCVPLTNKPSSYITISSFIPTASYSRYKNDVTPMSFRVNISNPYNQTYTTRWTRTFNGQSTDITGLVDSPTSWDIYPLYFVNEVGLHLITVDVLDTSSNIVATHGFQFTINNSPRPYIDTSSVNTTSKNPTVLTPNSSTVVFSLSIKNNGSSIPSNTTYRTDWKLYKNNVDTTLLAPDSASENFTDITPNGTNTTDVNFNPNITTGYGLGSFILRARIIYTPANEVIDERQWFITVEQPPVSKITGRALVSGSPLNPLTNVNAYHGVAYNTSTTYNFRPIILDSSASTALTLFGAQANFCVRVADGDGAYSGDGLGVRVSFHLDGDSGAVYEADTTSGTPQICLTDNPAIYSSIVFLNASSTFTQQHTIVARVYDLATGKEYTSSDMASGLSTYPVTWSVKVRPQNAAPTASYGSFESAATCTGSNPRLCSTTSDTLFATSVTVSQDDFYVLPTYQEGNFDYSVGLYLNNVLVQECSKSDPGEDMTLFSGTGIDSAGPTYECWFRAPSYNAAGPIDPSTQDYKILASVKDDGSPINLTDTKTSNVLQYNVTVSESNSAYTAADVLLTVPAVPVNEGSTIGFSLDVTDDERDDFYYQIKYCPDAACTVPSNLTGLLFYDKSDSAATTTLSITQSLTEDFLKNVSGCENLDDGVPCSVDFFAYVEDKPHTAAVQTFTTARQTVTINSVNPPPTFNFSGFNPVASTTLTNLVGIPFTITAAMNSAVFDTSAVASEQVTGYQWFVRNATSVTTWTKIEGATGFNLVWTPSLIDEANLATDNPIEIMLCVDDRGRTINVTTDAVICSDTIVPTPGIWTTTVSNNIVSVESPTDTLATSSSDLGRETAVWMDTPTTQTISAGVTVTASQVFTAYVDNANVINVKRSLLKNDGTLVPDTTTVVTRFNALPAATTADVRDLSITGDSNQVYIAYRASGSSAPTAYYPQVRRILTRGASMGTKLSPNENSGKVGFSYVGQTWATTSAEVTVANNVVGGNPTITFAPSVDQNGNTVSFTITRSTPLANITKSYSFTTVGTSTTICGGCTGTQMATDLARIINESTDNADHGITATTAANVVTIHGSAALDYLDGSGAINSVADDMGDIFISGSNWYLPFINSSLGGADKDKTSILKGTIDEVIGVGAAETVTPLSSTVQLSNLATSFNGSRLFLAGLAKSGSALKLYRVDPATNTIEATNLVPMSTTAHTDVEVAAGSSLVHVMTTVSASPVAHMYGIYDLALGQSTSPFLFTNTTNVDNTTANIFSDDLTYYRLVAYGTEARLLGVSDQAADGIHLYAARVYNNGTNWQVTCKECVPLTDTAKQANKFVRVSLSPIRTKVVAGTDYTLGTAGATANQNKKDIFFVSFGDNASAYPQTGVINAELEQINSTSLESGAEDAGLYRPPFFKN